MLKVSSGVRESTSVMSADLRCRARHEPANGRAIISIEWRGRSDRIRSFPAVCSEVRKGASIACEDEGKLRLNVVVARRDNRRAQSGLA